MPDMKLQNMPISVCPEPGFVQVIKSKGSKKTAHVCIADIEMMNCSFNLLKINCPHTKIRKAVHC